MVRSLKVRTSSSLRFHRASSTLYADLYTEDGFCLNINIKRQCKQLPNYHSAENL